ncbi:MAG TPA: ChaN family lipoprotein, partial [Planctomycetota bacterium]|nr:ChaN family lipoprotein [Planctomycetota bacterium]
MNRRNLLVLLGCLAMVSCRSLGRSHDPYVLDTVQNQAIPFETMVADLAHYDVVFLGENHDHTQTHAWQMRTTEELFALRPDMVISMEMFERDDQASLDAYLAGELTEEAFLEQVREWPNYREDYRPAVEFAKQHGLRVVAANCPRSLASQAYKEGLESLQGNPMVAAQVDTNQGRYYAEFQRMLGGDESHGGGDESMLQRMYVAQCVKDDTMAESIARQLNAPGAGPLVVHWCGRGHSDHRLGT